MQELNDLRKSIDEIDDLILEKLNERMKFVKKIGELKQASGTSIYRPERERAIINRLNSVKGGLLNRAAIEAIYLEIFAVSRNLEMPQKIAYLGPEGTYTHQAAESRFGAMSEYLPLATIESVFTKLSQREVKYGVVPIENNTEGAVGATLDCLAKFENVKIVAEIYLDIHHSFVSMSENLKSIKTIYSHPQGYNQCKNFLESHMLSEVTFVPTKSTSQAAYFASQDPSSAAICSKIAAKIYNVPILFETIEDNMANRTRFFILSDFKTASAAHSKTSILAKTSHKPGSLAELLRVFKDEEINLTKLESRPLKQRDFDFMFFIDFVGHIDDERVKNALEMAKDAGAEITWLGSYLDGDER